MVLFSRELEKSYYRFPFHFYDEGLLAPHPTHTGGLPLVSFPILLLHYILKPHLCGDLRRENVNSFWWFVLC
jgi:hypothetical protein